MGVQGDVEGLADAHGHVVQEVGHGVPLHLPAPSPPPDAVLLRAPGGVQHGAVGRPHADGHHLGAGGLPQHQRDEHVRLGPLLAAVHVEVGVAAAHLGQEVQTVGEVAARRDARHVDPQVGQQLLGHGARADLLARDVHELLGVGGAGVDLTVREDDDAVSVE